MPQYLNVYIQTPIGTDIQHTNDITKDVEEMVMASLGKESRVPGLKKSAIVSSVIAQVGQGTADPAQGPVFTDSPNKARIQVSFYKYADRNGINTTDIMNDLRDDIEDIPGVQLSVTPNADGPPQGNPINIELQGDDYIKLLGVADSLRLFLNDSYIPGIEELKLDVETGKAEMPVIIDRDKARRMNVSTGQIGDAMRTALFGKEISTFKDGEDDYPIMLRFAKKYAYDANALMAQKITFRNQSNGRIVQIPLSSVAHAERSSTYSAVNRKDLERTVTVFSNVLSDYNPTEVNSEIGKVLNGFEMPKGVSIDITGQQEEQAEQMEFLTTALAIAVFMILLIIIAQFNSASTPLIILTSVVLSLIGVLLGLVIFQMEFVIMMTMIGIISLAGVVVNNAIVLIDYTKLIETRTLALKDDPNAMLSPTEQVEAVIEGGKKRLRPVLLTAITTVLGLVPMAIGLNIDFASLLNNLDPNVYIGGDNVAFWGPMSWAIIFGLTFATFLTLVIVPAMYLLLARMKRKIFNPKVLAQ
jgi:multidrug efflux pump subunit AcrB